MSEKQPKRVSFDVADQEDVLLTLKRMFGGCSDAAAAQQAIRLAGDVLAYGSPAPTDPLAARAALEAPPRRDAAGAGPLAVSGRRGGALGIHHRAPGALRIGPRHETAPNAGGHPAGAVAPAP